MVNELTEICVAGGNARILLVILNPFLRILRRGGWEISVVLGISRHFPTEVYEGVLWPLRRRQRAEQAPKPPFKTGRSPVQAVSPDSAAVLRLWRFLFRTNYWAGHEFLLYVNSRAIQEI